MNDYDTKTADLKAQARSTIDRAATTMHDGLDQAHDVLDQAQQRVNDVADATGRRMHQATQWVADHPLQALAGALFVGYLAGRMRH